MIGRFLEFSIHTPDVLASLAFYEHLGFTQVTTGEAWSHPYAVVTDGRLGIGLHQHELPQSLLLSFVLPDLFAHLEELEGRGIEVLNRRLGSDVFNEATFVSPGGQLIRLLEARTFSPSDRAPGDTSRLGWFEEIALPVDDIKAAEQFWERLGFVPAEEGEVPFPHVGLISDSLNVALVRTGTLSRPTLMFTDAAMATRIGTLASAGIEFAGRLPGDLDPSRHALLVAPEGTQLLLATAD
jgi:catechol 2,3-dioxygenase-like lactoylglutathione lyase family enzyme